MGSITTGFGGSGFGVGGFGGSSAPNGPIESLPASYYPGLLTHQYGNSTRLQAMTQALLQPLFDLIAVLGSFEAAFDLDTAVGQQLDILGVIVGVSRTVAFVPTNGVSPVLDDPTYRLLIKARIGFNQFNGNLASVQALWMNLFPSGNLILDDFQDMTADIILSGSFSSIIIDLISNGLIVPRPQAVLYNYIFPVLPVFGLDQNTDYVAGVDLGHMT